MVLMSAELVGVRERIGPVGVWFGKLGTEPAAVGRAAAATIEELGYPTLWISEGPTSKEALTHAGILLAASQRLVLATGIAHIWARDANATNNGSNALAEAYPGRFLLGLGVSHAPLVTLRGQVYERPLEAMRRYLEAIDQARYDAPPPEQPVPRVLAALRPKMLELSRDHADGAHPYLVPPEHTVLARERLGEAPLLAPEQTVVIDTDPARARALAREFVSNYLALPNYVNNLRALGYGDDDLAGGGSDRLVDAVVVQGDVPAVVARIRAHLDAGADHVAVQALAPDVGGALSQLRELATALPDLARTAPSRSAVTR
jgi:probable F420-dependent oxidoreductase